MLGHVSRVQLFATLWTVAHQALCPWDSPGKNTGEDCHVLPQGIFLTQESNQQEIIEGPGNAQLLKEKIWGSPD